MSVLLNGEIDDPSIGLNEETQYSEKKPCFKDLKEGFITLLPHIKNNNEEKNYLKTTILKFTK